MLDQIQYRQDISSKHGTRVTATKGGLGGEGNSERGERGEKYGGIVVIRGYLAVGNKRRK